MPEPPDRILDDDRKIEAVSDGPWSRRVGDEKGTTKIVVYGEKGQMEEVPHVAIYEGDHLAQRVSAHDVMIHYAEPEDEPPEEEREETFVPEDELPF